MRRGGATGSFEQPSRAQWLRRLASRRRDRVGFVLSGGGPLGALQVGTLRALLEHGIRPELVVGTSVGAMNAAFLAFEPSMAGVERLEETWRKLTDGQLFPGVRFGAAWARMLRQGNRVFDNSGMRRLIETGLPAGARFEDAAIPLAVVATDLETGAEKVFTSGEIAPALLASAAMPGVFPPVAVEGRLYIDGGVANNVPIAPAVAMGGKTLYVSDATAHAQQRRPLTRPLDYLLHAFSLSRSQRLALEQPLYEQRVRLVMLPSSKLDFYVPFASMSFTSRLIAAGYEVTRAFLSGAHDVVVEKAAGGELELITPSQ